MNVTVFENAYFRSVESIIQSEDTDLLVSNALRFVIQNVFLSVANSFTITISSGEATVDFWFHDIMRKLFTTWGIMSLNLVVLDKKIKQINLPGKRYCNLIIIDNFESLQNTNIAEYNRIYDSLEYYFIFLQNSNNRFKMLEMQKIFQYCLDNYWINCNVMTQNSPDDIYIYTYFPFEDDECFQAKPKLINEFIGDRFVNADMFPDKLQNLYKCPLKLCTWDVPPFVINKSYYEFSKKQLSGFEMMMINAISRVVNFTIDIELIEILTYPDTNLTFSKGPLGYLKDRQTNISMGYFRRTAERDEIGTPSFVTYYLPLVAIVLRKQNQYESLGILTFPFDKFTWLWLALSYGSVFLINSRQRKLNKLNIFNIFEMLIGMPLHRVPTETSRKMNLVIWILCSFVLRSVYQSLLFYLYRTHFFKSPPLTLEALAAAGYEIICHDLSKPFIAYVPQIIDGTLPVISLNSSNEMEPLRYLEIYPEENLAAISIRDFAYYYAATEMDAKNALQILPINVNDQQIGIYVPKHSFLIERFNNCILIFHQAGLLERWRAWTNYASKVSRRNRPARYYENEMMTNLKQLIGFFNFIMFLYLISIVLFLLELISMKVTWLQDFF